MMDGNRLPVVEQQPLFDTSAAAFVESLRSDRTLASRNFSADEIYELYSDYYGDGCGDGEPLTRLQLFRRIGVEGLQRFREPCGKRLYRYRLKNVDVPRAWPSSRRRSVRGPS